MYERRFGTDWDALAVEEIIERAYALGVETVLAESADLDGVAADDAATDADHGADAGADPGAELERLTDELSGYDRSIIDLAYEEGRTEALEYRAEAGSGRELWDELVADESVELSPAERGADGDGPAAPVSRPEVLERYLPDGRGAASLPSFLTRD